MSWDKQMEEIVNSWTDMQRRMWNGWMESVTQFSREQPQSRGITGADYQKHLQAWEASVKEALEAQSQWARRWSETVGREEPTTDMAAQWTEKLQEMMKGWTDSQYQLWEAWFESIRNMDPERAKDQWGKEGEQVMEAWHQAAERAQETLTDWARQAQEAGRVMGEGTGKTAPGSRNGKGSAGERGKHT